jgi:azobenzene reductase
VSEDLQILLISGSVRRPSHTLTLTKHIDGAFRNLGIEATHWDLGAQPLPIADPDHHDDPLNHSDRLVRRFVADASVSGAFVLASPIYHNSYSGVLKNALDHLAIEQFAYKPVGLVSHGGNRSPQAVDQLRIVVRGLHGLAIPTQVCTQECDYRAGGVGGYQLESEDVLRRIDVFAAELVVFASRLRSSGGPGAAEPRNGRPRLGARAARPGVRA